MLFVIVARADDVARSLARLAAAPVELERLVPPALVVRVDAEVVEHVRLPAKVAELLVDRQGEAAERLALGASELGVGEVEQEVGVRDRVQVAGVERVLERGVVARLMHSPNSP